MRKLVIFQALLAVFAVSCGSPVSDGDKYGPSVAGQEQIVSDVSERLAQFVPTRVEADLNSLSDSELQVLNKLIEASRYMDEIFLRQAWGQNTKIQKRLSQLDGDLADSARSYFDLNFGPWDRLDSQPFLGEKPRPDTAGFYPPDMSREEFETWLEQNPESEEEFKGLFSVIRREAGKLKSVPYSEEYAEFLEPAAALMREAADLSENESLARYLRTRADAFFSGDYYESDVAWMDLDSRVEVTIGPYETYEDRLFGYKAAFESFVTVSDPEQSANLAKYKSELPAMEQNLPIPDKYKNPNRGAESPIRVVDEVFTAGDTKAGVQTIAFNLPNDEKVREEKGSKKVLLRNVMNAKFEKILDPIAHKVLHEDQLPLLSGEAFFNETLFHELSHGLGPGKLNLDGRETEVRLELKEHYSPMEEAKADVMGVYNILFMIDRGYFPKEFREKLFVTYLAGFFRSVRFGIEEAHGRGTALQFNYYTEKGAIRTESGSGVFSVNMDLMESAVTDLLREICVIQAKGDYEAAGTMLEFYAKVTPDMQAGLDRLTGIPVDVRPIYPAAGE